MRTNNNFKIDPLLKKKPFEKIKNINQSNHVVLAKKKKIKADPATTKKSIETANTEEKVVKSTEIKAAPKTEPKVVKSAELPDEKKKKTETKKDKKHEKTLKLRKFLPPSPQKS